MKMGDNLRITAKQLAVCPGFGVFYPGQSHHVVFTGGYSPELFLEVIDPKTQKRFDLYFDEFEIYQEVKPDVHIESPS